MHTPHYCCWLRTLRIEGCPSKARCASEIRCLGARPPISSRSALVGVVRADAKTDFNDSGRQGTKKLTPQQTGGQRHPGAIAMFAFSLEPSCKRLHTATFHLARGRTSTEICPGTKNKSRFLGGSGKASSIACSANGASCGRW